MKIMKKTEMPFKMETCEYIDIVDIIGDSKSYLSGLPRVRINV